MFVVRVWVCFLQSQSFFIRSYACGCVGLCLCVRSAACLCFFFGPRVCADMRACLCRYVCARFLYYLCWCFDLFVCLVVCVLTGIADHRDLPHPSHPSSSMFLSCCRTHFGDFVTVAELVTAASHLSAGKRQWVRSYFFIILNLFVLMIRSFICTLFLIFIVLHSTITNIFFVCKED